MASNRKKAGLDWALARSFLLSGWSDTGPGYQRGCGCAICRTLHCCGHTSSPVFSFGPLTRTLRGWSGSREGHRAGEESEEEQLRELGGLACRKTMWGQGR